MENHCRNETSVNQNAPNYRFRLGVWCLLVALMALGSYLASPHHGTVPSHTILHLQTHQPAVQYGGDLTISHQSQAIQKRLKTLRLALDPKLGQSAKAVLNRVVKQGSLLSSESLNFYLNAQGAVYWDTEQLYLETPHGDEQGLLKLLADQIAAQHEFGGRIGFAETWKLMPQPRRILLALIAHPRVILDPLGRSQIPHRSFSVGGRLAKTVRNVRVLALNQDGLHKSVGGTIVNGRFESKINLPTGQWTIEVVGDTSLGPIPLAQFNMGIGREPSSAFQEYKPTLRSANTEASTILFKLINDSRTQYGLAPLSRNPRLDEIATRHTLDMITHGFVGHASPKTGNLGHRLSRLDIHPSTYGENIARNTSILDAHRSLMHSVSHRLNILDPDFTDLGIGIRKQDGQWFVTELFAHLDHRIGYLGPSEHPVQ